MFLCLLPFLLLGKNFKKLPTPKDEPAMNAINTVLYTTDCSAPKDCNLRPTP